MPMNEEGNIEHEPAKSTDPAHSSSDNSNHTTKKGTKPETAFEAIADSSFFPTLDDAPLAQKIKSYLFLGLLVFGAVLTLWFFEYELLQTRPADVQIPLTVPGTEGGHKVSVGEIAREVGLMTTGASAAILGLLYVTGTANVDFWSLVIEYGWWTIPLVGLMGVVFVIMQEDTESISRVE